MKTAEEWLATKTPPDGSWKSFADYVRAIQADALRHAAKIVDDRRHNGLDTDLRSIRTEIEIEVAKLEAK